MGELYKLKFSNGKAYIGVTVKTANHRFIAHKTSAKRRVGDSQLYNAWAKHGEPTLNVLAVLENEDLYAAEIRAIKVFGTFGAQGYNSTLGGEASPSLNPLVAKKISEALKGRPKSAEHRRSLSIARMGHKWTKEQKLAASLGRKGRPGKEGYRHTPETRANMSARRKGNRPCLGFKHTAETRQKVSASLEGNQRALGFKHTAETRAKTSDANKRRWAAHRAAAGGAPLDRVGRVKVQPATLQAEG